MNGFIVVFLMSNLRIAIIAEDNTDCQTVRKIVHRLLGTDISIEMWGSNGCPMLKRKLTAHLETLSRKGCNVFIIVHDLDRNPQNSSLNDESQLRKKLEELTSSFQGIKHICIPIEELEAWFWSDPEVIKHIGRGKGKAEANPDKISKPKEKLIKLSEGENGKARRYSVNKNVDLAAMLNLDICADRCPSFKELHTFLLDPLLGRKKLGS